MIALACNFLAMLSLLVIIENQVLIGVSHLESDYQLAFDLYCSFVAKYHNYFITSMQFPMCCMKLGCSANIDENYKLWFICFNPFSKIWH